jgi:hypothetical protein
VDIEEGSLIISMGGCIEDAHSREGTRPYGFAFFFAAFVFKKDDLYS